ncbi:type VII secretion protein EccB [Hamadaea sp. NPDC051192]|uniref:type VII secretion protein EccB n=1 Tax=Hamadaea sp. NPDC051192 TaxID=3154940 RepID=UPI0034121608
MWTQRDQLQAHRFLRRRVVSALQAGQANPPTPPARAFVVAFGIGVIAAALLVAAFAIYGVLRPGASG